MTTPPYWHSDEWRALLLAVVAEPEDAVRWMRCIDWLEERGEHAVSHKWAIPGAVDWKKITTSAEWYQSVPLKQCVWCQRDGYDPACIRCVQDGERVYPCKELAWTLPIREVVFTDAPGMEELRSRPRTYETNFKEYTDYQKARSELALRFARS